MSTSITVPIGKTGTIRIEGLDDHNRSVIPALTVASSAPAVATGTLTVIQPTPAVPAGVATPAKPATPGHVQLVIAPLEVGAAKITATGNVAGHAATYEWDVTVTAAQPQLVVHTPVIA